MKSGAGRKMDLHGCHPVLQPPLSSRASGLDPISLRILRLPHTACRKKESVYGGVLTLANSTWSRRVAEAMGSLERDFSQDELAYLALTSKVELPIRDRLAYSLHRHFGNIDGALIAREWKRDDLGIIIDQKPRLLLEAKAMYVLNIWDGYRIKFLNSVKKDLADLKEKYSDNNVEKLLLVLATDCYPNPEKHLDDVVKYSYAIRNYYKNRKSADEIQRSAEDMFCEFEHFSSGRISGGHAFGMEVGVYYWLFGPY